MSPGTVSRCVQVGLLFALSDRLLHVHRMATLIHATMGTAPTSAAAAAAAAAAAPWHSITISVT